MDRPLIQLREDAVIIILSADRRRGAQDCQGVPAAPLTIRLLEPLGERKLMDGGVFPPRERPRRR